MIHNILSEDTVRQSEKRVYGRVLIVPRSVPTFPRNVIGRPSGGLSHLTRLNFGGLGRAANTRSS
jgi:hypothetical protein